jgi:hypothetical protein
LLGKQPGKDDNPWLDEWLEVQVEKVWTHYWLAQWPEMDVLVNKLQPVVKERGRPANRMRLLWASGLMNLRKGRYTVSDEMLANSREALDLSEKWGSPKSRVEYRFELGFLHLWRRELDEAGENLQASLELARTCEIVLMQILSLTYLTVLHRFRGRVNEVLNYARQAQEAAEAAQMPAYVAAARGNQAWLALRGRDLPAAEQSGRAAIGLWQQSPLVYPFQWQALWPLIAVTLEQDREDEAWAYVRALFEPTQQHLPQELDTALGAALQAKRKGQESESRSHLDGALKLAWEMGYL